MLIANVRLGQSYLVSIRGSLVPVTVVKKSIRTVYGRATVLFEIKMHGERRSLPRLVSAKALSEVGMKVVSKAGTDTVPQSVIGSVYPVFSFEAKPGARCEKHSVKAAPDADLWALMVGEHGRGRWQSALLVSGAPQDEAGNRVLSFARLAETRSGQVKLVSASPVRSADYAIVHVTLGIGFRGGNGYSGDVQAWQADGSAKFLPSPWIPLAIGEIAEGAAGNMGGGIQIVAALRRGVVARTYRTGRLYNDPASRYWYFDGDKLYKLTKDDRDSIADSDHCFPPMTQTQIAEQE